MNAYMPPSKTDDWATPLDLWEKINYIFHFDLDAAASKDNHLCDKWFGLDHDDPNRRDGLSAQWDGVSVWVNPPYGRGIYHWVEKAHYHALDGNRVVMLLPARTDTKWFHEFALKHDVTFIKGRLKFGNSGTPAPFPSLIIKM